MSENEGRILRALIVDDEPLARDNVRLALEKELDVEVIAECADGESAIEAIRELEPDVVFLDVQMPGTGGFDVVNEIGPEEMPAVVFVTAFDEHALRAFEVHALDYVLKPFDDDRFSDAVEHARRTLRMRRDEESFRRGLSALMTDVNGGQDGSGRPRFASRLMVRLRDRIHFVRTEDVDWFEAAGNYVRLHVADRSHLIRSTMSAIEERLDPQQFVRIHRSTIVNVDRIKEIQPWAGGDYLA
ncbi:MAG TPA: LytTR family DNA-binding domain-containing protein, partial [Longimicrobiales bacterium]